jgi:hypothetical protein
MPDTARAMSQENVEIVRKSVHAFLENDFEAWFALTDPACRVSPRLEEPVEWRMFGPVEEALEALGLSEQDAHT